MGRLRGWGGFPPCLGTCGGARAGGSGRKTAWNRNSVPQAEESLRHLPQPEATPSRLSNHPPHTHTLFTEKCQNGPRTKSRAERKIIPIKNVEPVVVSAGQGEGRMMGPLMSRAPRRSTRRPRASEPCSVQDAARRAEQQSSFPLRAEAPRAAAAGGLLREPGRLRTSPAGARVARGAGLVSVTRRHIEAP